MLPHYKAEDPEKQNGTDAARTHELARGQDSLAEDNSFDDELASQEPDVDKWPLTKRIIFALVGAASLWAVIALGIYLMV